MSRLLLPLVALAAMLLPVPEAAAATQQVHMSGYAYGPSQLTIKVGDTVTWTNHDQAPHDAVVTAGPAQFRSPMLSTGQSWSFTFTVPGTYSYYCSVHPDMRAQVVAQALAQAPPPPVQQQQQQPQNPKRQPAATTPRAASTPSAAAAPPVVPAEAAAPEPETVQPAVAMPMAEQRSTLDPLLLIAGLVAAVATLCLLLIGSRSSTT